MGGSPCARLISHPLELIQKTGYMLSTSVRTDPSQLDFRFLKWCRLKAVEANTHRHRCAQCWWEMKEPGQITEKFALWLTEIYKLIFAMGLRQGASNIVNNLS